MQKRILIINNGTHFIDDLMKSLSQYQVEIKDFQTVELGDIEGFDSVILSGGGTLGEVADNAALYQNEIKIVRESKVPIFGICEGFQVIGKAFDSVFQVFEFYREGVKSVRILLDDPIFQGIKNLELRVFEYHHIAIEHLGEELKSLAVSEDGIEVMKHKDRLIYASQFHPEELQDGNDGHIILNNFLSMI
ncbi:gamma-glutamyl-gamma-aminobutyrate hydrolase family protein [Algoriphagus sp. NF]|jgi:anthranilate/para-aminobenzoate synthase component II|uniref:glutamine amidotransferase-related protein n=1 Tax=Algoriphagus sp. NF TaxID=2992756 RepID=UPI001066831D|nr:gamma-glutamyl-gamma-aminobutyrate hydrolase family protein [Algoriphagus sp. NF]MDE0559695.1 gamma-glutamyl-gamma-aminobutyrate hydrolase family protein [Algoriphagus sp. NF]